MKIVLGLLMAAILTATGIFLVWQYGQRKWDGQGRFTVITVGDTTSVASFDPELKQGFVLTMPNDLEIESVGGRGKWQVGSLSKTQFGFVWAADSVSDYLGIYYTSEMKHMDLWDKWEWMRWHNKISWKNFDMDAVGVLSQVTAVDGTNLKILGERWPDKRQSWFESARVVNENLNVTIVNSTNVDGLGTHAARSMEADGVKVRQVITTTPEIGDCTVTANQEALRSLGVARIKDNLGCLLEVGKDSGVVVKLGKKYREWWL